MVRMLLTPAPTLNLKCVRIEDDVRSSFTRKPERRVTHQEDETFDDAQAPHACFASISTSCFSFYAVTNFDRVFSVACALYSARARESLRIFGWRHRRVLFAACE